MQTLATGHEATRQCISAPEEQIALSLHIFSCHPGNVTMSCNTPRRLGMCWNPLKNGSVFLKRMRYKYTRLFCAVSFRLEV